MVEHVVVDSGGFIRNAPIKDIGKDIYTIHEVVSEIRDKATRQRLQVLPYDLKFRQPSSDSIRVVTDFAKKTGDYKSLSAVDIRVLALTYQLEKEYNGTDHLRNEPDRNITWQATQRSLQNPTKIAGFYVGKKKLSQDDESVSKSTVEVESNLDNLEANASKDMESSKLSDSTDNTEGKLNENQNSNNLSSTIVAKADTDSDLNVESSSCDNETTVTETETDAVLMDTSEDGIKDNVEKDSAVASKNVCFIDGDVLEGCLEEGDSGEEDEDDSDDNDDDGGDWITPSNIKQVKEKMGDKNSAKAQVKVGCMTTDFSMQNVLIQMRLNVISVDGMLIKRAKNYVNRCYGCFKISTDMIRDFCHHCGNQTLQRVSMIVDEDGSIQYFLSSRRAISTRGTKFSLPMPKGGKHTSNPILCEDQKEAQQRTARATKTQYDVFDQDYVANASPFAPTDTHSRAAQLGIRGTKEGRRFKRNPNENKKAHGKRK